MLHSLLTLYTFFQLACVRNGGGEEGSAERKERELQDLILRGCRRTEVSAGCLTHQNTEFKMFNPDVIICNRI